MHTTFNILNKAHHRPNCDKTPYELWHGSQQQSNILKCSEVNVISKIMMRSRQSLMLDLMREYSWDIHKKVKDTDVIIKDWIRLWNA